jgi:hypothetical protein
MGAIGADAAGDKEMVPAIKQYGGGRGARGLQVREFSRKVVKLKFHVVIQGQADKKKQIKMKIVQRGKDKVMTLFLCQL